MIEKIQYIDNDEINMKISEIIDNYFVTDACLKDRIEVESKI